MIGRESVARWLLDEHDMRWGIATVALLALMVLTPGCYGATFDAAYPDPDYIAQPRSPHSFALADQPPVLFSERICSGHVCVRGLRAQMGYGLGVALGNMAVPASAGSRPEYIAELSQLRFGLAGRSGSLQLSLGWHFTLHDTRTGQDVVRVSDSETIAVASAGTMSPDADLQRALQQLEHRAITRIEEAVRQSSLIAE